jgi:hypothetical protein
MKKLFVIARENRLTSCSFHDVVSLTTERDGACSIHYLGGSGLCHTLALEVVAGTAHLKGNATAFDWHQFAMRLRLLPSNQVEIHSQIQAA